MEGFRRLSPEEFDVSAFRLIGKDWLLITTEALGRSNAMTASWGGMGVMWNKPVLYLVIRPQRFTRELLDENGRLLRLRAGRQPQKRLQLSGHRLRQGWG